MTTLILQRQGKQGKSRGRGGRGRGKIHHRYPCSCVVLEQMIEPVVGEMEVIVLSADGE